MAHNIFQLWAANGQLTPFGARRHSWADKTIVIVEEIVLRRWPYGEAYGEVYVNNVRQPPLNSAVERSPSGLPSISCAGSYQWSFVEMPGLPKGEPPAMEEGVGAEALSKRRGQLQKRPKRKTTKHPQLLKAGDRIGFGTYREQTIESIFRTRPSWIEWAIRNVQTFVVEPEILDCLNPQELHLRITDAALNINRERAARVNTRTRSR